MFNVAARSSGGGQRWPRDLARKARPRACSLQRSSSARLPLASTQSSANAVQSYTEAQRMPDLPELNPIIHGKLRLALLSLLAGVEEADFVWLRNKTGSTDGNLGAQLASLEEAGYVRVKKSLSIGNQKLFTV